MKPKEKHITKSIRDFLKVMGIFHWKEHGGLGSAPGVPDLVGVYEGRLLAIEIKTDKGKLSPQQKYFLEKIAEAGGIAFVARSVEDVIDNLGLKDRILIS
jgi:penicillin-binding protein-related factor A (putative recombinase)